MTTHYHYLNLHSVHCLEQPAASPKPPPCLKFPQGLKSTSNLPRESRQHGHAIAPLLSPATLLNFPNHYTKTHTVFLPLWTAGKSPNTQIHSPPCLHKAGFPQLSMRSGLLHLCLDTSANLSWLQVILQHSQTYRSLYSPPSKSALPAGSIFSSK